MPEQDALLRAFCHPERSGIREPWIRNGWHCATDGRVILRVRTEAPDTAIEPGATSPPPMESIFQDFPANPQRPWLPYTGRFQWVNCAGCGGSVALIPGFMSVPGNAQYSLSGTYALLIASLPGVQLVGPIDGDHLHFTFAPGGQGVVMLIEG